MQITLPVLAEYSIRASVDGNCTARHARHARLAPTRALPSLERPVAQSDGVMRESFMHVHAASCIPIHASCVAAPFSAAAIRLQPFSRSGTPPNARRPIRSAASQPTMK
jgi:hypothetical protein